MKKFFTLGLIFVCLLSVTGLYAAQRSHDEMVSIAKQTLGKPSVKTQTLKANGLQAAAAISVEEVVSSEAYSVFNSDNGFVLVSTDDRFPQVLGYGVENKFDPNDMPPALVELLESYDKELRVLDSVSAIEPVVLKEAITFDDSVKPLIKTQWDQGTPYNDSTPMKKVCGSDCKTATGCVATAMAQVMKYYKHPTKGIGSHSYAPRTPSYICGSETIACSFTPSQPYANFGNTTYQYDKMLDSYSGGCSPDAGSAVAQLMYHCGVAAEMDYGCDAEGGSGSKYAVAVPALATYFNYDPNYQRLMPELFETENLYTILRNELKAKRPIFTQGEDASYGGHAFLLDGYNQNGFFHFNWGWGGKADGYFLLSALNPKPSSRQFAFNNSVYYYIGIQPKKTEFSIKPYLEVHVADFKFLQECLSDGVYNLKFTIWNANLHAVTGTRSIKVYDDKKNVVLEKSLDKVTINGAKGGEYTNALQLYEFSELPNGNYYVYISFLEEGSDSEVILPNISGDNYITLSKTGSSSVCVVPNKEPELEGLSLTQAMSLPNALNQNRTGDALSFSVKNSGDAAINGTIQARILTAGGDSVDVYGTTNLTIGNGETKQGSIQGTYGEKVIDNTQYTMSLYWREKESQAWQKLTPDGFNSISFKISASSTESDTTEIYDTMCQSDGAYWEGDWFILVDWFEPGETTKDTVNTYKESGKDSIVHLHLTLLPSYNITKYDTICQGETFSVNGITYSEPGTETYSEYSFTTHGCDSVVKHYITINPIYAINVYDTISQGETFKGTTYNTPGNYTYPENLHTTKGCDSIVTHYVTVNQVYSNVVYDTLCQGETYALTGTVYNTPGNHTYTENLKTTLGSDSTVNHHITVNPIYNIDKFDTICQGSTFALNSTTYNNPGTFPYTENLTTVKGCDSVVTHHITVNPTYTIEVYDTICEGGSLIVNGISYNTPGTYTENLTTSTGCDSIVNHHLAVSDVFPITRNDTICKGESITISGHTYTTAGSYTDTIHATEGCDSVLRLTLTVLGDTTTIPVNIDLAAVTLPYVVDNYYTVPANTTSDTIVYVATERCLYNKYDVKIKQATPILTPTYDIIKIEVSDCLGRLVQICNPPISSSDINLPYGIYILKQFYSDGSVKMYRVCVR